MKILVAHPQRQHSDKLAAALVKAGHDVTYMTTVYMKSRNLTGLCTLLLSGDSKKKARGRRNGDIPDSCVKQKYELLGLTSLLLSRIDNKRRCYDKLNKWIDRRFGRKVAHIAIRNGYDAVVCYDAHALHAFEILSYRAPDILRVLDMSAAALPFRAKVFLDDFLVEPALSVGQKQKMMTTFDFGLSVAMREIALADRFLAASEWVMQSLEFVGVDRGLIALCPYGSHFPIADRIGCVRERMRFVFCGRVKLDKGIHRLFQAFENIDPETFELILVGDYGCNREFYDEYSGRYLFMGLTLSEKVHELYLSSDVFILPSLSDGMSLACLEALACGLPLIVSNATGVAGIVEDGVNGFVVPLGDTDALRDRIIWCIDHSEQVSIMKENALESAKPITWAAYEGCIAEAFKAFVKSDE